MIEKENYKINEESKVEANKEMRREKEDNSKIDENAEKIIKEELRLNEELLRQHRIFEVSPGERDDEARKL